MVLKKISSGYWFLAVVFALLAGTEVSAQSGSDRWYFGNKAGVNFTTNPPTSLQDGVMNTFEGCATLTDAQGDLLLYTNGIFVYNRLHQQMPNGFGLWGDSSSFQSVVLAPKPGSDSLVYAFTVESVDGGSLRRFSYSIIDLSLDNGLGDVVSKNNLLLQPVTEYISAVKHANGIDYWITVHEVGSTNFYTYLLTASGVNTTPVISAVGPLKAPYNVNENLKGQIKFSPDGTRLTMPDDPGRFLAVFDFNAATGVLSNYKKLRHLGNPGYLFGAEFSPSGRYVYSAASLTRQIFQWDLISNDTVQIAATRQQIATVTLPGWITALQLGPDGKIYTTRHGQPFLGVINNPDLPGSLSNFVENGLDLSPKICRFSLPTCVQSSFKIPFTLQAQFFCLGDSTRFSAPTTAAVTNYQWNFGDPASGSNNTSTAVSPGHVFSGPGQFIVTLTATAGNLTFTQSRLVVITALPVINVFPAGPLQICPGDVVQLQLLTNPQLNFQWMLNNQPLLNDTLPVLNVSATGNYQLHIQDENNCTAISNEVIVGLRPSAEAVISQMGPFTICPGNTQLLNAQKSTGTTFTWLLNSQAIPGASTAEFTAAISGNYQVVASGAGLCPDTSAAVLVNFLTAATASVSPSGTVTFCSGGNTTLTAVAIADATYQWLFNGAPLPGAESNLLSVSGSGTYQVVVTGNNSCSSTSGPVQVTVHANPEASLAATATSFCEGESVNLQAPINNTYSYTWHRNGEVIPGAQSPEIAATTSGSYKVILTNAGICHDTSETILLTQNPLPIIGIEHISGAACGDAVTLRATGAATYSWSTGQTGSEILVSAGNYTVTGVSAEGCKATESAPINFDCPVVAPNIITPNNDGLNEEFALKFPVPDYDLQVFSRWGKVVFERKSYGKNQNWKAEGLPDGLYFYSISTINQQQYSGWVEVLR